MCKDVYRGAEMETKPAEKFVLLMDGCPIGIFDTLDEAYKHWKIEVNWGMDANRYSIQADSL